ncbi:MAG: FG-GAP-like repeat-containing protein [Actinomycetota bacterium]
MLIGSALVVGTVIFPAAHGVTAKAAVVNVSAGAGTITAAAAATLKSEKAKQPAIRRVQFTGGQSLPLAKIRPDQRSTSNPAPPLTSNTLPKMTPEVTELPALSVLGVTWPLQKESNFDVQIRQRQDGRWGNWESVHNDPQEGPDPDSAEGKRSRAGTEPVVVDGSDAVQARVVGGSAPSEITLDIIDPGSSSGTASAKSAEGVSTAAKAAGLIAVGAAKPAISTRSQWGADESLRTGTPSYGAVKAALVHHTVNSNSYSKSQVPGLIRGIYAYHVQGRGWSDIGYNFVIDRFGGIWEGRYGGMDRAVTGAHARGFNGEAFGAATIGDFDLERPPAAVISAYQRLFAWKATVHQFDPSKPAYIGGEVIRAVSGHRDVGQTACPGKYLYQQVPTIGSGARSLMGKLPALTLNRDLDSAEHPDVVGINDAGALQRLAGNGTGGLNAPRSIGTNWDDIDRLVVSGDWNGDGAVDVLGRNRNSGSLYLYAGTGADGFRSGVRIGTGWNSVDLITGVGDWNGDGHPDIVARQSQTGALILYGGNGKGSFAFTRQIGTGWSGMNLITGVGDWDGDGRVDLVSRGKANGLLYLYRGSGGYGFLSGRATGPGWQNMTAILGAGDTDGNGRTDLYARRSDGTLVLYRLDENGRWARTNLSTNLAGLRALS